MSPFHINEGKQKKSRQNKRKRYRVELSDVYIVEARDVEDAVGMALELYYDNIKYGEEPMYTVEEL
jgi:hypothetical protein